MKQLLRDSLPQIVGTIAATAILALIGLLYAQLGLWVASIALVAVLILAGITSFVILRRKKPKPLIQKREPPSTSAIMRQPRNSDSTHRQTILFVDDDIEIIGAGFIIPLEEQGFDVVVATNAFQALQVLQSDRPLDLVVTDLVMPFGDEKQGVVQYSGLEVIKAARKLRGNIPVICFSVVHSDKEIPHQLQELGVTEHLLKPIRPSEFVQRVKLNLLLFQSPPQQDLIANEIRRRRLELKSGYAYTRVRALWALGELGHYDPTTLDLLKEIVQTDEDSDVRTAATEAISKIETTLQKQVK